MLWQIYYGRYMTADILRQIRYGRYIVYDKNCHNLKKLQRLRLSIAASESPCCNASLVGRPWALL